MARGLLIIGLLLAPLLAHARQPASHGLPLAPASASAGEAGPPLEPCDRAYPISLQAALELSGARVLDIQLAEARVREALAELQRTRVLWLPTVYVGIDYIRHDGRIQDIVGEVFDTSRSAFMAGVGPHAVFSTSDALFAPLAQKQVVAAREFQLRASENDGVLAIAVAFFNVQQARGELAGYVLAAQRSGDLLRRAEALSESVVAPVEVSRARAEHFRRRQQVESARERWRTSSAELARLLRLPADTLVEPVEPPSLKVTLIGCERPVDELIPLALTYRPELAAQQALVQATLARLRHEKLRPLMPSVLIRGAATNPAGTLSTGVFGGGVNANLSNFAMRNDIDVQLLWEFQNLGFGNRARVRAEQARNDQAVTELFRTQDRIAAEVARAHAEVRSAASRAALAEEGLKAALDSARMNFEGLQQTKQAGRAVGLLVRPQEAVASVQALAQAYADYYGAIADYDRAQFRLYRALGQPPQELFESQQACPALPPTVLAPPRPNNAEAMGVK